MPTMYQILDWVLYIHLILRFEVGVTIFKVRLKEVKCLARGGMDSKREPEFKTQVCL